MNHTLKLLLAVGLACGAIACEDDPAPVRPMDLGPVQDATPDTGAGGSGGALADVGVDLAHPDAGGSGGVEVDMAVDMAPDMAVDMAPDMTVDMEPDMAVDMEPDMAPDATITPLPPGDNCDEQTPCEAANNHCFDGQCRYSLTPNVYRMYDAQVIEPANSGAELQGFLQLGIASNSLNLMFEAAGFVEGSDGLSRWYVGNGYNDAGNFAFRHNLPIQTWDGRWSHVVSGDTEMDQWRLEGETDFVIVVPTGQVELEDGTRVNCDVRLVARVEIEIWEAADENGLPIIMGETRGHLTREDVERVVITMGGQVIRLIDFFDDADLVVDSDGDGVMDAYPFDLLMKADPQPFADDNAAREAEPRACDAEGLCDDQALQCVEGLCVHPACGGGQ